MLVLTFQIGHEPVGLDIRLVREVVPRVKLRPLSGGAEWLAGVFVYRGRVIPVVDLHRLAGHGECPTHLSSRIILVPHGDGLLGLLATQVADLREIPDDSPALPSPATGTADLGRVIADGLGVLRLLEPERLLPPTARALVASAGATR
jgi:chemotaxis-related protein WspB